MNRRFLLLTSLVVVALGISAVSAPMLGRKLGKIQKIKEWGYSLRIPEKWTSVPEQPGETKIVGGWQPDSKEVEKRYDVAAMGCDLKILRYPVKAATTQSSGKAEEASGREVRVGGRTLRVGGAPAKTIDEYIENTFEGASKRFVPKKITAGRGSSKLTGRFLEFTSGRRYICMAIFTEDNWDWGILYRAPEDYYKREWEKVYRQSIDSFRLFEPSGERPYAVAPGIDKSKLSPAEKRMAIKAGIAGNPGWWALDTKNYVFLTNSTKKTFLKELGREIEIIREKVYEKLFPPTKEIDAISIVRVFSDQSEYHQYGGPRGSAGYWNASKEELVLFENFAGVTKTKSKQFTKSVMYHEAFHQYIYYAVGDIAPHSWFNEGHGDFFAGHVVSGSRVRPKLFDWRVTFLKRHLGQRKNMIPIRSLVRLPQREYYSNAGLKYSQGWALIYFLREVTKKKSWQAIPDRYFTYLRDNIAAFKTNEGEKDDAGGEGVPGIPGVKIYDFEDRGKVEKILEEAVDKGFEGIDYEELDVAFTRWVESIV